MEKRGLLNQRGQVVRQEVFHFREQGIGIDGASREEDILSGYVIYPDVVPGGDPTEVNSHKPCACQKKGA